MHASAPSASESLQEIAQLLQRIDAVTADPQLQAQLGDGLVRELRYPIASFRQRFPNDWPTRQPQLF